MIKRIIIIFLLVSVYTHINPEEYSYKNIYIYSEHLSSNNFKKIKNQLDKIEEYFVFKYDYIPDNQLNIFIFDSVYDMTDKLDIPYWIGGYYSKETVFLQPIEVLIKKKVFEKVLFIEYAHYYIDSYTFYKCPYWLNEMLSYDNYLEYSKTVIKMSSDYKFKNFQDFINIKHNMKSKEKMTAFYNTSSLFISYLNRKYRKNFFKHVLLDMHNNVKFNGSIKRLTGRDISNIFDKDFLK